MQMKPRILCFALVLAALILAACTPGRNSLLPNLGGPTPTPTPFLPQTAHEGDVQIVPVALIEDQPQSSGLIPARSEDFPPPAKESDLAVQEPVGSFVQPEGQV